MIEMHNLIIETYNLILQFLIRSLELNIQLLYLMILILKQTFYLHFLKLRHLPSTGLILSNRMEVNKLLLIKSIFEHLHLFGSYIVTMIFLFVKPVYLSDKFFYLPLVLFKFLVIFPKQPSLLEINRFQSLHLCSHLFF